MSTTTTVRTRRPRQVAPWIHTDEASAVLFLERVRWDDAPICPHCAAKDATATQPPLLRGRTEGWLCGACRGTFSVRTGTILDHSRISLAKWQYALLEGRDDDQRLGTDQLGIAIGVSHPTASMMLRRVRAAMLTNRAHVGDVIAYQIDARGWSAETFMERALASCQTPEATSRQLMTMQLLLDLRTPAMLLGTDVANELARIFDLSADEWLEIDRAWREAQLTGEMLPSDDQPLLAAATLDVDVTEGADPDGLAKATLAVSAPANHPADLETALGEEAKGPAIEAHARTDRDVTATIIAPDRETGARAPGDSDAFAGAVAPPSDTDPTLSA